MPLLLVLLPTLAVAAGGGDHGGSEAAVDTGLVLALIALVGGAYLTAHFASSWLQRRFLVQTGAEYVLLGLLLGPHVLPQIHVLQDVTALAPIVAFAAGWHGLLSGMQLDLRTMSGADHRAARVAIVGNLAAGLAVALPAWWFFGAGWILPPTTAEDALLGAGFLGSAAMAGSGAACALIRRRYPDVRSSLLPLLDRAARDSDILAIALFGLLFCFVHHGDTNLDVSPGFSDWVLLTVGLGLALGILFALFLGPDEDENHRFLALVGIIVFASGAAFFVNLSALLVNLLLGVVLANTRQGAGVAGNLQGTAQPVRLILMTFAGALWVPVDPIPGVLVVVGAIALRGVGLAGGAWLATRGTGLRADTFRGMVAQGEVALAIALSFRLVYDGPAIDLAYTAILASVVLNELAGPWTLRGLLADARELDDERVVADGAA